MLARMYANGLGTEQNAERADFWYSCAAKSGDPESQYAYGTLLTDKTDPDPKKERTCHQEGMNLLKGSADQGYRAAMDKYIDLCRREPHDFTDLGCAVIYCKQLLQNAGDAYEQTKYTKAKRNLTILQIRCGGAKIGTTTATLCYTMGTLITIAGALYLLAGLLPDLYVSHALLQKLPSVTDTFLIPLPIVWNWIFTFLNMTGAFGLELMLLGEMIRTMVEGGCPRRVAQLTSQISGIVYVGIAVWYYMAYPDPDAIFQAGNIETIVLVLVAVFLFCFAGYAIGSMVSGLLTMIFPPKKGKQHE